MSEQTVRETLRGMLRERGPALISDARQCEVLLRDLCPADRREVNLLVSALKEGIPAELREGAGGPTSVMDRAVRKLEHDLGLSPVAAVWTVETWALGLITAASPREKLEPVRDRGVPAPEFPAPADAGVPSFVLQPARKPASQVRAEALKFLGVLTAVLIAPGRYYLVTSKMAVGTLTFGIGFVEFFLTASVLMQGLFAVMRLITGMEGR